MSPEQQFVRFREHADVGALGAVFDALAPELLVVAAHLVGAEAEDLVQATFLDAIEKAPRWDATRRLLPWLIGILVNHARVERRRRGRQVDTERLPARAEPSPFDTLAADELATHLEQGLRSLPRQLRQTLTLRLVHGLSVNEIAHTMGCPLATAKTRLQRGTEWLRRVLPAGIGAALAIGVTAAPGLAAVRAAVLARGKVLVPGSATGLAVGVVLTGILMKPITLVAAVLLCVGAWYLSGATPSAPPAVLPVANSSAAAAHAEGSDSSVLASEAASPIDGEPVRVPVPAPPPGSAALEFVWQGGGEPASGLSVLLQDARGGSAAPMRRRADADGRVSLQELPAAEYLLSGIRFQHALRIESGREARHRFEVEPTIRVEGIVFDSEWRRIPDAVVFTQYLPDPDDTEPRRIAVSGADGTFRGAVDQGGAFWAQKPGYVPSPCWSAIEEGALQMVLVLGSGGGLVRGTVRTVLGQALPDAEVTIVRLEPWNESAAPIRLRTDARGAFETTELGLGEHLVVAQAHGHAATPVTLRVDGSEQRCDVDLARGATLQGRVVQADGTPAVAKLTLWPQWACAGDVWIEALRPLYHLCSMTAAADAAGRYRIEHVPAGSTRIRAEGAATSAPAEQVLDLPEGAILRCDLVLGSTREIRGCLLDEHEQAIGDWRVDGWPVGGGVATSATTDAAGGFVLTGLDAAAYVVEARPGTFETPLAWVRAANVRPGATRLVLRARTREADAGWFVGTLLSADGAPPRHATTASLVVAGESEGVSVPFAIDATGGFRLGPLPAGRYGVGLRVDDEAAVHLGAWDVASRQVVDLGPVQLPADGEIEVTFRTPQGAIATPVEVSVIDRAGNRGVLLPRRDGVFRSRKLPAGIYRLSAWGEDFVLSPAQVVVVADRTTAAEIQVEPATGVRFELVRPTADRQRERRQATVELRVHDAAGEEVAAGRWAIDVADRRVWRRGLRQGSYTFVAKVLPADAAVDGSFVVDGDRAETIVEIHLPGEPTAK